MNRSFLACVFTVGLLLAGCLGANEAPDARPADHDEGEEAAGPHVQVHEGNTGTSYATPILTYSEGEKWQFEVEPRDNTTGYVVEVEWNATESEHENLDLWIRHEDDGMAVPPGQEDLENFPPGGPLLADKGSSPLRLVVPVDVLEQPGVYHVMVRAYSEPIGIAIDQPFTLHIVTFEGLEFDDAFTVFD